MKKNNKIIGRIEECRRLDSCLKADTAQLIIVYGRRRVGKTFLINQYFDNQFAFKVTGIYGQTKEIQISNFIASLNEMSRRKYDEANNWFEAFRYLKAYTKTLPKKKKQVFFFDEMPWMDNKKSDFLSAFEWFWNDYASTVDNLVFIVCGSATSWMDEKIANNKGGLFNRQTCRLYLKPFKLYEVEKYLQEKGINWSRYDISECYMIMGGIPYYLSLLDNSISYKQNIDKLFFSPNGELWDEFDHLYKTLFTNSDDYIKVVSALSEKLGGLTRLEIIEKTGLSSGGELTKMLDNLILSGFVRVSNFYNKKKKDALYQLADYYTLFYFRYIHKNYGKDEHYWSNAIDNPARKVWAGLTFEQICKDHIGQIKQKLGISGVLSQESAWFTEGDEDKGITGAQIDLLIDRRDRVVSICEMKYSVNEFLIDKKYDMNLRNKVESFRKATNCKKSIQLVMVTSYGLKEGKYNSFVNAQITLDDLYHE